MPKREPDLTGDAEARRVLTELGTEQWQRVLQERGLTTADAVTDETREAVEDLMATLGTDLTAIQGPVRRAIQELLLGLEGKTFGSLDANQAVTRKVQDLLSRLGLRVICPKPGCAQAATLRCAAAGNSKNGVFQFDHSAGRKRTTHMGSSMFPRMTLTEAPADRRRADRPV